MKNKTLLYAIIMIALAIPYNASAYDFSYTYQGKTLFYTITGSYQPRAWGWSTPLKTTSIVIFPVMW